MDGASISAIGRQRKENAMRINVEVPDEVYRIGSTAGWDRCKQFYCGHRRGNFCCQTCKEECELKCINNNAMCNCLSNVIKGAKTLKLIRRET